MSTVFFLQFLVIKTLNQDSLEMLDPYPDPDSMNPPDPQHVLRKCDYCSELLLMHPDIDATLVNNQGDTAMEVAARSVLPASTMGTINYN
jgi:hypothetical protein